VLDDEEVFGLQSGVHNLNEGPVIQNARAKYGLLCLLVEWKKLIVSPILDHDGLPDCTVFSIIPDLYLTLHFSIAPRGWPIQ
jgi:hypothetical protein